MKEAAHYVALLFLARDMAHRAHLKASGPGSFAAHMALGTFYEGIVERADSFAEAYQGRFNDLLDIPLLENDYAGEIADVLEQQMAWIEDNREQICKRNETALHNLIDEAVALYQSTLYKLRFLE
jgi:DNA-binding ferritin-like protein